MSIVLSFFIFLFHFTGHYEPFVYTITIYQIEKKINNHGMFISQWNKLIFTIVKYF